MDLLNETLDLIEKYENEKRRNLSVNSATTIVQKEDISQRESTTESNITRINSNRSSNLSDLDSFGETESDYYSSSDSEEMYLKESSEEYRSFPVEDDTIQNDEGIVNNNSNNNDTKQNNNLLSNKILRKPHSNSTFSTPELICDSNDYDSSSSYDEPYKGKAHQSLINENINRVQSSTNPIIVENKGLKGSLLFKSNKSNNIEEIVKPDTNNSNSERFDDFVIPKRGISLTDDMPGTKQVTHYYSKQKKSPIVVSSNNEVKGQAEEDDIRDSLSSSSFLSNDQHGGPISRSFTIGSPFSIGSPNSSYVVNSPNVSFNGDINNVRPVSSIYRNQDKNPYRSPKKIINNPSAIDNNALRSLSPNLGRKSNMPIKSINVNALKPTLIESQVNTGKNKLENFNSTSPMVKPINGKTGSFDSNIKLSSRELPTNMNIVKKSIRYDEPKSNSQDKITEELSNVFHMINEMENNKNIMEGKQNQEGSNNKQIKSKHARKNSQASIKEISKYKMDNKDIPVPVLPNGYRLPDNNILKHHNPNLNLNSNSNSNSNNVLPNSIVNNNRDKYENQEKFGSKLSSQIDVIPSFQRSPMPSRVVSVVSFRPEDSIDFSRNNTVRTSSTDSDSTRMNLGGPSNSNHSNGQDELQMILNSSYVDSMKDRAIYEQQQHHFFKQQHQEMRMKMMQQQQQQQIQNHFKIQKLQQKAMMQQQLKQKNNNIKGSSSPSLRMNNIYSPVTSIADLPDLPLSDFDNRSWNASPVISPTSTYVSMDESIRSKMSNFRQAFIPLQPEGSMDFVSSTRAPSFEGIKDPRSRSPSFKPAIFGTPNSANTIKVPSNSSYSRVPIGPQYMNSPVASKKNILVDDNSYAAAKQRYHNRSPNVRSVVSNNELEVSMRNNNIMNSKNPNNIRSPPFKAVYNASSENISLLKEKSKLGAIPKRPVLKKSTSIGSSLGSYGVIDERKINSRKYF